MAKKRCPQGHIYDPEIYGDECPLCPPIPRSASSGRYADAPNTHLAGVTPTPIRRGMPGVDSPTQLNSQIGPPPVSRTRLNVGSGRGAADVQQRKLVGFLVTYNRYPSGRAFNLYEGRNIIGREPSKCDIAIPDDPNMSERHFSILYRPVDKKFKFHDEQSTNGTFVNKQLLDDGELQNYDIIRAGTTIFIFIPIPII